MFVQRWYRLNELNKATKACEEFADKRSRIRNRNIETFGELEEELNNSLRLLQETYEKYYLLFYAASTR